ncbi:MAG TPA: ferritin-like domain-containing protein [Allosphingosinicella sp.]|nr:ferritin-like domain-containing protein [Allosphingosinicella sp.]
MIGEAARRHRIREHDHATRLTPAERAFVAWLDANKSREQVLADLKTCLQVAVEVELATIPIYLFTYYSIQRDAASGEAIDRPLAFANKAAGIIMSVAVEEMLHMSLSANVLFAMGQAPILYGKAPGTYPTLLPYHNPVGPPGPDGSTSELVPLAKLSFEQLWHFLQIEYPEALDAPPQDSDWQTIGQLYSYVRCLLRTKWLTDADFQQGAAAAAIQPYNYSPNNVDTLYPTGKFDPWKPAPPNAPPAWSDSYPGAADAARFTNRADSHAGRSELLCIHNRQDAADAIDTICDQGEGYPVPNLGAGSHDDPSKGEESHYVKFLWLQAQYDSYAGTKETLPAQPPPPAQQLPAITQQELEDKELIVAFPDNPTTASYPAELQPIADFCSACFQYMLIMTETIYRVPPQDQKLFFNEGLHRSMIWVLDKYIRTIREIPIGGGLYLAPVFENIPLGERQDSFAALTRIGNAAVAAAQKLAAGLGPDSPLQQVYGDVEYYVEVAIGPAPKSGSRPLPDVGPYWRK